MNITLLGTGTSQGVPIIGCTCETCTSADPRDQRLRTSVWIETNDKHFLIDTSVDFRQQMLRYQVPRVDAILFTHHHFDHLYGLDDIRAYNKIQDAAIPCVTSPFCAAEILLRFGYAFEGPGRKWGLPELTLLSVTEAVEVEGVKVIPIDLNHGKINIYGYRIGNFAYLTDCNGIPEPSYALLENLDVLVLDCLQYEKHATHFCLAESLAAATRINAKQTYLTHISHFIKHATLEATLPERIRIAYDGLHLTLT
jgi:phosphoribosyl 1,2-cyclic phosphate phosphodiesterase